MATLASVVVKVGADITGFVTDMNRAVTLSERQSKKLQATFVNVGKVIGTGLGAALTTATVKASGFQTAMAEVSTLLDDTSSVDKMAQSVRQLSQTYGQDVTDQARALYQVISAGASTAADQMAILDAANKLSIGGLTNVATAADALTTVMNAYGMSASEAGSVSDTFFAAMRGGKTTVDEMANSIGQVATIAAQSGVSFDELGAAVATITKSGVDTTRAMTALRAVMVAVLKPSGEAADLAEKMGLQFNAAGLEAMGLAGFLEHVQQATGGNAEAIAKLFGRVEGLSAVMSLGADDAAEFGAQLELMGQKAGATDEAYGKMANTVGQQTKILKATLNEISLILGEKLLPALNEVIRTYTDWVNRHERAEAELASTASAYHGLRDALKSYNAELITSAQEQSRLELIKLAQEIERVTIEYNANERATTTLIGKTGVFDDKAEELRTELAALQGQQRILTDAFVQGNDVLDEVANLTEVVVTGKKRYNVTTYDQVLAEEAAAEAMADSAREARELEAEMAALGRQTSALLDELNPVNAAAREFEANVALLQSQIGTSLIPTMADFDAQLGLLQEQYIAQIQGMTDMKEAGEEQLAGPAGLAAVIENTWKRLDDTLQGFWNDLIVDGKFSFDSLLDLFKNMIAQMLHAAITQPIILRIGAAMGLGGSGAAMAGGNGGIGGGIPGMGSVFGDIGGAFSSFLTGQTGTILGSGLFSGFMGGAGGADIMSMLFGGVGNAGPVAGFLPTLGTSLMGGMGPLAAAGPWGIIGALMGSVFGKNPVTTGAGSAIGAGLGSLLPLPGIGTILGGLVGGWIGSLFGDDDPVPALQLLGTGAQAAGVARGYGTQDEFFDTGLGGFFVTNWQDINREAVDNVVAALTEFDNFFASFLNDDQLKAVTDNLALFGKEYTHEAITVEQILEERLERILGTLAEAMGGNSGLWRYVNRLEDQSVESQARAIEEFVRAWNGMNEAIGAYIDLDPAKYFDEAVEEFTGSSTERLARFAQDVRDELEGFEQTPESMRNLALSVQQRYQAEMEYLGAIQQLITGITQSIEDQQARIQAAIDGDQNEGRSFDSYVNEIQGIFASLSAATSPEEIAQLVAQAQQLVEGAFSTLDAETIASGGQVLIDLLDTLSTIANDQLAILQEAAIEESNALRDELAVWADTWDMPLSAVSSSVEAGTDAVNAQTGVIQDEHRQDRELLLAIKQELAIIRQQTPAPDFRTRPA